MISIILNPKTIEPEDYADRFTVKAVIVNNEGNVLLFRSNLIGGGVEEGETNEQALHREVLEETGIEIEIIKPLGQVIAYRDATKQIYRMFGYECKYIRKVKEPIDETTNPAFWENPKDSISRFQSDIYMLKKADKSLYEPAVYEAKLYNREMSLIFLKESFKEQAH